MKSQTTVLTISAPSRYWVSVAYSYTLVHFNLIKGNPVTLLSKIYVLLFLEFYAILFWRDDKVSMNPKEQ